MNTPHVSISPPVPQKRILFVMHDTSLTGASICIYKLIRYLQQSASGYDILVHSAHYGILIDRMRKDGIASAVILTHSEHSSRIANLMRRLSFYFRFSVLLITFRPNVLFSNTISNFGHVVLGKLSGAKTIVWVHEGLNLVESVKHRLKFSSYFTDKYIAVSNYVSRVLIKTVNRSGFVVYNSPE